MTEKITIEDPDKEYLNYLQRFPSGPFIVIEPHFSRPLSYEDWCTHRMVQGLIVKLLAKEKTQKG